MALKKKKSLVFGYFFNMKNYYKKVMEDSYKMSVF